MNAGLAELLGERGLARAADAAELENRRFLPGGFDSLEPKRAVNHDNVVCVGSDYL